MLGKREKTQIKEDVPIGALPAFVIPETAENISSLSVGAVTVLKGLPSLHYTDAAGQGGVPIYHFMPSGTVERLERILRRTIGPISPRLEEVAVKAYKKTKELLR